MTILSRWQFYGEEFITPPQEAYRWYQRYPYTVVAAAHNDNIVGFVNLFPVKKHIDEALRAGEFNDHFLTLDGVEDIHIASDTPLHMFLCCVVVDSADACIIKGRSSAVCRCGAPLYGGDNGQRDSRGRGFFSPIRFQGAIAQRP